MSADVLNSWKEIAAYTHRGVRTLQRWEREMDFPIRRPQGKDHSSVMAFKFEIDLWFRMPHGPQNANSRHRRHFEIHRRLLNNTKVLETMTTRLINCCDVLGREINLAFKLTSALRSASEADSPQALTAQPSRNDQIANLNVLRQQALRLSTLTTAIQARLTDDPKPNDGIANVSAAPDSAATTADS